MISAYDIILQRINEWRTDEILTKRQYNKTVHLIDRIFLTKNGLNTDLDNLVAPELLTIRIDPNNLKIHLNIHFTYRLKRVILRTHLREEVGGITLFYYNNDKLIARVIPECGNAVIVESIKQLLK